MRKGRSGLRTRLADRTIEVHGLPGMGVVKEFIITQLADLPAAQVTARDPVRWRGWPSRAARQEQRQEAEQPHRPRSV